MLFLPETLKDNIGKEKHFLNYRRGESVALDGGERVSRFESPLSQLHSLNKLHAPVGMPV